MNCGCKMKKNADDAAECVIAGFTNVWKHTVSLNWTPTQFGPRLQMRRHMPRSNAVDTKGAVGALQHPPESTNVNPTSSVVTNVLIFSTHIPHVDTSLVWVKSSASR